MNNNLNIKNQGELPPEINKKKVNNMIKPLLNYFENKGYILVIQFHVIEKDIKLMS